MSSPRNDRIDSASGATARVQALRWLPVVFALAFLAQVALLGLAPALAESRRLDQQERRLSASFEAELARKDQLERMARARTDPIYQERERLWRLAGHSVAQAPR